MGADYMLFHLAICDDMPTDVILMENSIKDTDLGKVLDFKFYKFSNGLDLLKSFRHGRKYDLIILDINLSGLSGESIAIKLRELGYDSMLVFCTAENNPTIEAFKSEPFRFITKSFADNRMRYELNVILKNLVQKCNKKYILGKKGSSLCRVKVQDILYIETSRNGCKAIIRRDVNTDSDEILFPCKIDQIENSHCEFSRIHKSYLVNLSRISEITRSDIVMEDGTILSVSRPYQKLIKDKYKSFFYDIFSERSSGFSASSEPYSDQNSH